MAATSENFNIRWNNHATVFNTVIRKLLVGETFVDVTLACEGRSIKCHRVVLSACSTYFEKILLENASSNLVIYLKDTKIWELKALVTFMYNGEVSVNQQKLAGLVKAAEALKIKGLAPETMEEPDVEKEEEEEFDLSVIAGIKNDTNQKKEESILRITKQVSGPPPLAQGVTAAKQQVKRKQVQQGMTNPPRLVKMRRIEVPPKLQQANGVPAEITGTRKGPNSLQSSSSKRKVNVADEEDTVLHEFERAEIEDMYGEGFNGLEEQDLKDVENMEHIDEARTPEEDGNGSNETHSTGSDNEDGAAGAVGGTKLRYKYGKDIRDSALSALNSGVSLRQCSEAFGIPRKTLSKWKAQELRGSIMVGEGGEEEVTLRRTGPDVGDRAERLQRAMELAMSGTTVRQAAAHYDIPRTTLCAYMKRRGVAPKRNYSPGASGGTGQAVARRLAKVDAAAATAQISQTGQIDDFPFLGISDFIDGMGGGE